MGCARGDDEPDPDEDVTTKKAKKGECLSKKNGRLATLMIRINWILRIS